MRYRLRLVTLLAFYLVTSIPSQGFSYDCIKLAPLLRTTTNNAEAASSYRRVVSSFLDEETRSYKHLLQRLQEAKISIPVQVMEAVFPLTFEGKNRDDESQWEEYRRIRKQYFESNEFQEHNFQASYSGLQQEALRTIEACFASQGLHVFDDYTEAAADVANIYFNYQGEPGTAKATGPIRITPSDAWTCTSTYLKNNGQIGNNFRNESCARNRDVDATLTVVTDRGSKSVNFPNKVQCSYRVEEQFVACANGQMGKRIQKRQYCAEGKPVYTPWIDAGGQCAGIDCKSTSEVARAIYRHALKREPSPGEIEASRSLLSSGVPVRQVLKNVISTEEFKIKFYSNIPPHPNNHLVKPGLWGTGALGAYTPQVYSAATPLVKTIYEIALAREIDAGGGDMSKRIADRCGFMLGVNPEKPLCYGGFLEELRDTQMNGAEYLQRFGEDVVPYPSDQPNARVRYYPKVSDCLDNAASCR